MKHAASVNITMPHIMLCTDMVCELGCVGSRKCQYDVSKILTNDYLRRIYIYIQVVIRFTMAKRNTKSDRLKDAGVLNPQAERVLAPEFQIDTFFDPRDLLQVKYEMLRMVRQEGATKAEAAERFGLSRPTLYQAQAAFDRDGLAGLLPRQRGPKGAHKLDARIMAFIDSHLDEGGPIQARRLALLVEAEFGLQVHPRSIERALQRKKKRQQK